MALIAPYGPRIPYPRGGEVVPLTWNHGRNHVGISLRRLEKYFPGFCDEVYNHRYNGLPLDPLINAIVDTWMPFVTHREARRALKKLIHSTEYRPFGWTFDRDLTNRLEHSLERDLHFYAGGHYMENLLQPNVTMFFDTLPIFISLCEIAGHSYSTQLRNVLVRFFLAHLDEIVEYEHEILPVWAQAINTADQYDGFLFNRCVRAIAHAVEDRIPAIQRPYHYNRRDVFFPNHHHHNNNPIDWDWLLDIIDDLTANDYYYPHETFDLEPGYDVAGLAYDYPPPEHDFDHLYTNDRALLPRRDPRYNRRGRSRFRRGRATRMRDWGYGGRRRYYHPRRRHGRGRYYHHPRPLAHRLIQQKAIAAEEGLGAAAELMAGALAEVNRVRVNGVVGGDGGRGRIVDGGYGMGMGNRRLRAVGGVGGGGGGHHYDDELMMIGGGGGGYGNRRIEEIYV